VCVCGCVLMIVCVCACVCVYRLGGDVSRGGKTMSIPSLQLCSIYSASA
jgi:hypothetical protein